MLKRVMPTWILPALLVLTVLTKGYGQSCDNSSCCSNVGFSLSVTSVSYSGNTAAIVFSASFPTVACSNGGSPIGSVYTATYSFGDGGATAVGSSPSFTASHTYTLPASCSPTIYTVSACVANELGNVRCTKTQTVSIGNPNSFYTITAINNNCKAYTFYYYANTPLASHQWNFGDGSSSSVITNTAITSITHTYATGGTYAVSLSGTGISECPATYQVTVPDFVPPNFTYTLSGECSATPTLALSTVNYTNAYTYSASINNSAVTLTTGAGSYTANLQPGINSVQLTIYNGTVCSTGITKTLIIGWPSAYSITATNTGCKTFSLSYAGASPLYNAQWAFGDGSLSSVITNTASKGIQHTYPGAGTYVVNLTGLGIAPCTLSTTVNVSDFETADFSYTVNSICTASSGITLGIPSYTNNGYTYNWTINGFMVQYAGNPASYSTNLQQGVNTIKFTITSASGCQTSITKLVSIGAPSATFSMTSQSLCTGAGLSAFGVAPGADSYSWTVTQPGGSTVTLSGMNPAYTYTAAGVYQVKLSTVFLGVCTSSAALNVTVSAMPDASFTQTLLCNGIVTLSVPGSTFTSYNLNYGDGTSFSGGSSISSAQLSHTYAANGTYPITLNLVNGACTASHSLTATISNPSLSVNAAHPYVCPGGSVPVTAVLSFVPGNAGTVSYSWTGSGGFSASQAAVQVSTGGTFQVTVSSNGTCPLHLSATKSITALAAPAATLVSSAPISCTATSGSAVIALAADLLKQGYCINGTCTAANPGATTSQTVLVSGLGAGANYINIANGLSQECSSNLSIPMQHNNPALALSVTQPTNCSGTSGSATVVVTPSGGTTSWYTQANAPTTSFSTGLSAGGLSAGSYVVQNVNGYCLSQTNFSIGQPVINLSKSGGAGSCAGNTSTVSFSSAFSPTALSGSCSYTLQTINGSTLTAVGSGTNSTYTVTPGHYSVSVSANGCVNSQSFTVNQLPPMNVTFNSKGPNCSNAGAGIAAMVTGGDGSYNLSYSWLLDGVPSSTLPTYYSLPTLTAAVVVSLTVTDPSGCSATHSVGFAPHDPVVPASCGGVGTMSATTISSCNVGACVAGGNGPYNFSWYKLEKTKKLIEWEFYYDGLGAFVAQAGAVTLTVGIPAGPGSLSLTLNSDSSGTTAVYPFWNFSGMSPVPLMNSTGVLNAGGATSTNPAHYYSVTETVTLSGQPSLVSSYNGSSGQSTGTGPFTTGNYSLTVTDADGCAYTFSMGALTFTKTNTFPVAFDFVWGMGGGGGTAQGETDLVLHNNMIEAANELLSEADQCMAGKGKGMKSFLQQCSSGEFLAGVMNDELRVMKAEEEHHHTLYYYDRAGRLTKTVPPEGVVYLSDADIGAIKVARYLGSPSFTVPAHRMATTYTYNTFGQLTGQNTPDGGRTQFIYDSNNRLRFSQNDRQRTASPAAYSYTRYDALGRISEVGESTYTTGLNFAAPGATANVAAADNAAFPGSNTREVTHTYYTAPAQVTYYGQPQRFIQNRVSYVSYDENPATPGDEQRSYFSYDAHGNVEWLVQENAAGLGRNYVGYDYDLVSGKVLQVRYNEKRADRFFHRYAYDAENRLVQAQTSDDGEVWDNDASYSYYPHGPLKRSVIGEDHVQGLDYIYTLQGWLKAMNSPSLTTADDPGADNDPGYTPPSGKVQERVAADRHGMVLNYFAGDYTRSGNFLKTAADYSLAAGTYSISAPPLYNGNIRSWVQSQLNTTTTVPDRPRADLYQYDLLNRLRRSRSLHASNSAGTWTNVVSGNDHGFNSNYRYDRNGNLLSLARYDNAGVKMDSLEYTYDNGQALAALNSNRLREVEDLDGSSLAGRGDLEGTHQYTYDATGNLIRETGAERANITGTATALCSVTTAIEWTVYGKIKEVNKTMTDPGAAGFVHLERIKFAYDAPGNRISKEYWKDALATHNGTVDTKELTTTYYVRDAQGNPMATYQKFFDSNDNLYKYQLVEQPIYGSDRLGLSTRKITLASSATYSSLQLPVNGAASISEYQNWITTTNKSQLLPNGLVTDNLCQCRVMSVQNGTANPNYADVQEAVKFLGLAHNGVALAEDLSGTLQFYAVLAKKYLGINDVCLVFDKNGKLMKGTESIGAMDPNSKPVIVNLKGTDLYALITLNASRQPVYHIIDMGTVGYGPVGNAGEVIATNQALISYSSSPAPEHGYHFTGLEDHINGRSIVYSSRYTVDPNDNTKGTTDIVAFDFGTGTVTPQSSILYSTYGCGSTETGELQISPGGDKLAWYQHEENLAGFNIRKGSIHTLPLDLTKTALSGTVDVRNLSQAGNSGNGMLEFMKDNSGILYAQRGVYKEGPGGYVSDYHLIHF